MGKYYGGVYRINKRKKELFFLKKFVETIYVTNSSTMQKLKLTILAIQYIQV